MQARRRRAVALGSLIVIGILQIPTLGCASTQSGFSVRSLGGSQSSSSSSSRSSGIKHYRLPLDANPVDAEAANKCFSDCQSARRSGRQAFLECLSTCPGYEEGSGACGAEDVPPKAYCVDETVKESMNAAEAIGTVLGLMVAIPLAILICAKDPKHCKDDDE